MFARDKIAVGFDVKQAESEYVIWGERKKGQETNPRYILKEVKPD